MFQCVLFQLKFPLWELNVFLLILHNLTLVNDISYKCNRWINRFKPKNSVLKNCIDTMFIEPRLFL